MASTIDEGPTPTALATAAVDEDDKASLSDTTSSSASSTSDSDSANFESPPKALPIPRPGEGENRTRYFETKFFKQVAVFELLKLASEARGGSHQCRFGERDAGSYNVVLFIIFDDEVEWVVKLPKMKTSRRKDHEYLKSEYATMVYLHSLGTVPVPKIYGGCFGWNNPAKSPYFFMEKVSGMPLSKPLSTA